jgi:hypothetical protein
MARLLLLLLLLPAQDPDRGVLLRQLGDPSPSLREQATRALESQGDAALSDLRKALDEGDPEIRCRAAALIDLRTQEFSFATLQREQRASKLGLADLLLEYDYPPGEILETDGVRFTFTRRPWAPDGEVLGTLFETETAPAPHVQIDWRISSIRDGATLPFETCAWHSPRLVYVPGAVPTAAQLRIRGTRRWFCGVPIRFLSPSDGVSRRFAGYTVTVHWPDIEVRSDRPVDERAMGEVLRDEDIHCTLRPGMEDGVYIGMGVGCGGCSGCGRSRILPRLAWCGCRGEPTPQDPTPRATSRETKLRQFTVERYPLSAIESIELTLHLPVEESFEVISPLLK